MVICISWYLCGVAICRQIFFYSFNRHIFFLSSINTRHHWAQLMWATICISHSPWASSQRMITLWFSLHTPDTHWIIVLSCAFHLHLLWCNCDRSDTSRSVEERTISSLVSTFLLSLGRSLFTLLSSALDHTRPFLIPPLTDRKERERENGRIVLVYSLSILFSSSLYYSSTQTSVIPSVSHK